METGQLKGIIEAALLAYGQPLNIDQLRENLGALEINLTAAELSALDADFSKLTVHGGRMNEMQMRAVERAG